MSEPKPLILTADHTALREIKPWLLTVLSDVEPSTLGSIELAVHELAANSVDHSAAKDQTFRLTASREPSGLTIELRDTGEPFDPAGVVSPDPDEPQERGYGLMIIEQLVDELDYRRDGDANVWRAVFSW